MRKNFNKIQTERNSGFTLVELLVVIAIIGILSSLAAINFQQARLKARDVRRKNAVKQLQVALEAYRQDQPDSSFPATYAALTIDLVSDYVKRVPLDPKEVLTANTWNEYFYETTSDGYRIIACLENDNDNDQDETQAQVGGLDYCSEGGFSYTVEL